MNSIIATASAASSEAAAYVAHLGKNAESVLTHYLDPSATLSKKLPKQFRSGRKAAVAAIRGGTTVAAAPAATQQTTSAKPELVWVLVDGKAVQMQLTSPPAKVKLDPIWDLVAPKVRLICPKADFVPEGNGVRIVQKGRLPQAATDLLTLASKVSGNAVFHGSKTL